MCQNRAFRMILIYNPKRWKTYACLWYFDTWKVFYVLWVPICADVLTGMPIFKLKKLFDAIVVFFGNIHLFLVTRHGPVPCQPTPAPSCSCFSWFHLWPEGTSHVPMSAESRPKFKARSKQWSCSSELLSVKTEGESGDQLQKIQDWFVFLIIPNKVFF